MIVCLCVYVYVYTFWPLLIIHIRIAYIDVGIVYMYIQPYSIVYTALDAHMCHLILYNY